METEIAESTALAPRTYADIMALVALAEPIECREVTSQPKAIKADDDPHRLARINLDRYSIGTGGKLVFWRDEWYTWKASRGCYRVIKKTELFAKVARTIEEEFDRLNIVAQQEQDADEIPVAKKVTMSLVNNVVSAMASICCIPSSVNLMTWLLDDKRTVRRDLIAVKNGILNINDFLAGSDNALQDHSSDWFSTNCLPYEVTADATCPKWLAFLHRSQEGDQDRINLLQEWMGYLLLPNTDQQKFMFFEGEGSNGKSVFLAATEAMLGEHNCSHVSLEIFGQPFMLTQTLGKLVNIAAECSDMDSVAEGYLKSFTSGDRMMFNRKGIDPIEATPTARLMVSANVRPRFSDRSSGLWRRMILMPWRVTIMGEERVVGMDKVEWWQQSGELPGIFLWAVLGLERLRRQRQFTTSKVCEAALVDYRLEVNPAKAFLIEFYEETQISTTYVKTSTVYDHYKQWALDNGYRPISERTFGKEVHRQFPNSDRRRTREGNSRFYAYYRVQYSETNTYQPYQSEEERERLFT